MKHDDDSKIGRTKHGAPSTPLAIAFGKHPAWSDHINDPALVSKDTPELEFILGLLQTRQYEEVIRRGTWAKLDDDRRHDEVDCLLVRWRRAPGSGGTTVISTSGGRPPESSLLSFAEVWASADALGRSEQVFVIACDTQQETDEEALAALDEAVLAAKAEIRSVATAAARAIESKRLGKPMPTGALEKNAAQEAVRETIAELREQLADPDELPAKSTVAASPAPPAASAPAASSPSPASSPAPAPAADPGPATSRKEAGLPPVAVATSAAPSEPSALDPAPAAAGTPSVASAPALTQAPAVTSAPLVTSASAVNSTAPAADGSSPAPVAEKPREDAPAPNVAAAAVSAHAPVGGSVAVTASASAGESAAATASAIAAPPGAPLPGSGGSTAEVPSATPAGGGSSSAPAAPIASSTSAAPLPVPSPTVPASAAGIPDAVATPSVDHKSVDPKSLAGGLRGLGPDALYRIAYRFRSAANKLQKSGQGQLIRVPSVGGWSPAEAAFEWRRLISLLIPGGFGQTIIVHRGLAAVDIIIGEVGADHVEALRMNTKQLAPESEVPYSGASEAGFRGLVDAALRGERQGILTGEATPPSSIMTPAGGSVGKNADPSQSKARAGDQYTAKNTKVKGLPKVPLLLGLFGGVVLVILVVIYMLVRK